MPRGGARPGSGPKEKPKAATVADKSAAARLIEKLNSPPNAKDETLEVSGWRLMWDAQDVRIRLDVRKYLYDKRDGKPVQTVNHIHDKPIEMNVTLSLSEAISKARKRAGIA